MRFARVFSVAAFVVAMTLAGSGCSPEAPVPPDGVQSSVPPPPSPVPPPPAPSTPAQTPTTPDPVPAVAPVPKADPVDLLANGNFYRFDEGQIAPRHWTIGYGFSLESMPFKLEPLVDPVYSGGHAIRQTWTESDTAFAFHTVFGQTVEGLKPNTDYRLEVVAHNESKNLVIISAFEMEGYEHGYAGSGEAGERLNPYVVQITPGTGLIPYSGTFRTKDSGTVKLGARIEGKDPVLPGSVVWDSWKLTEVQ